MTSGPVLSLFGPFFNAIELPLKSKRDIDGNVASTFAFVTVAGMKGEASDVIREYNGLKWKKHSIRVQVAQESFMQRLARERRVEAQSEFNKLGGRINE